MSNIEELVKDILLNEISNDLAKRIAKALEINEHLTSTYELSVNVEDILSTDRNADPSNSGFYVKLEGTRSGVSFFYNNNLEFSRKPNSKSVRVVKRYNNIRGFEESFWFRWAEKWLKNDLVEKIVKKSDGYYVTSEDGKKNLGGPYDKEGAEKRLQQVHYFKNKGKKVNEEDTPKQKAVNRRSKRDIAKLARDKGFEGLIDARDLSIHHIDSDSRDINGLKDNSYKNLWFIKGGKNWKDRELIHKIIHFMDRNDVSYDDLLDNLEDFKLYQYDEETGNFKERTLSMFRETVKVNESKVIDISKLKPFKTIKAGNGTFWKFYKKDGKTYDDRGLEVSAEEIKNLKLDETIEKFVKIDDDELLKMADTLYDNGIITKNQLLFGSLTDKDIRKLYRKWFKENGKMRHKPKEESLKEDYGRNIKLYDYDIDTVNHKITDNNTMEVYDYEYDGDYVYATSVDNPDNYGILVLSNSDDMESLTEAKSAKKFIYTLGSRFVAHQLNDVTSEFKREFDASKKYRDIVNNPNFKHGSIGCKHKSYKAAVNQWVKDVEPTEFMVLTQRESPSWKDDVIDVYYRKDTVTESLTEDKSYFPWGFGEDDSFFTREELDEFTAELQDIAPSDVAVYKAFIDSNNVLEVDWSYQDFEETSSMKIDMRKIKTPSDLIKRYLPSFKFLIDSRVNAIEMGIDESLDNKKSINESSLVKDNIELDDGILEWGWEKPNSYYVEKNYWVDKDNSLARVDFKRYYSSPEAARRAFNRYKKQFGE